MSLNVGGVIFMTRKSTLKASNSFFSGLVASCEEHNAPIFVDRDPTFFRHILNYMRGAKTYPNDESSVQQLIVEAEFYSMVEYVQFLREKIDEVRKDGIAHGLRVLANKINL